MSTVYLVSRGDYSDYHIEAVCSTREKAQLLLERLNGTDPAARSDMEAVIEEMELDAWRETPKYSGCYTYTITADPGAVYAGGATWNASGNPDALPTVGWHYLRPHEWSHVTGYGASVEHARRSAAELVRACVAGSVINPNLERDTARAEDRERRHQEMLALQPPPPPTDPVPPMGMGLGTPTITTEDAP